ncbi:hypothetical protein [Streptomyces sp. NPDC029674]|uniref:hypothetical protein n=1 Tax=Streptomyces sp. NPDC029674 TaxID=3365297 RepID=UPI003850D1F3
MRLRHTLAAAFGAFTLVVALPASASAATGEFHYKYVGPDGMTRSVSLHDPHSPACVTLPEVADPKDSEPAFAAHNDTDAWARVFTDPNCTGGSWALKPHGKPATDRLKLRSVYLSDHH